MAGNTARKMLRLAENWRTDDTKIGRELSAIIKLRVYILAVIFCEIF